MDSIKKIIRLVDERLELWLITLFFSYFIAIVILEVTLRYVFNSSTIIGEETARHSFIYLSWFAASYVVKNRTHIRIGILDDKLSLNASFFLTIFYNILFVTFCVMTLYYVFPVMQAQIAYGTLSRATRYPMWFPYLAIPLGVSLLLIRVIQNVIIDYKDWKKGFSPGELRKVNSETSHV